MIFTTISGGLDSPVLMPMYLDQFAAITGTGPGTAFYRDPTTGLLVNPVTGQTFPNPGSTPGTVTDFETATKWNNVRAQLGAVDLNRPLADYRPTQLNRSFPNNCATRSPRGSMAAARPRHLARLVIVSGSHARGPDRCPP